MKRGGLYKHDNNTDVAALVLRIVYIPEKVGYKIKVSWMNIVNKVFPCGVTEEIFIESIAIRKWKPYFDKSV